MALSLTPAERSLRARRAAFALHAQGGTSTKAGTAAFLARFEKQVDPDGTLPADERVRRARFALRSHMALLGLKASKAQRARCGTKKATAEGQDPAMASVHGGGREHATR